MTNTTKRSLFGGALLCAGLMAGEVQAQYFSFQYTSALTRATEYATNYSDFDSFVGGGFFEINSAAYFNNDGDIGYGYARMLGNQTAIQALADASNGFAYALVSPSYFQVDQNVLADITWDFTGGFGNLDVYDVTNGSLMFDDAGQNSGLQTISLVAGHQYAMGGVAFALDGHSEWTLSIVPTPGGAGLLGLVGLAAARRRRPSPSPAD